MTSNNCVQRKTFFTIKMRSLPQNLNHCPKLIKKKCFVHKIPKLLENTHFNWISTTIILSNISILWIDGFIVGFSPVLVV